MDRILLFWSERNVSKGESQYDTKMELEAMGVRPSLYPNEPPLSPKEQPFQQPRGASHLKVLRIPNATHEQNDAGMLVIDWNIFGWDCWLCD